MDYQIFYHGNSVYWARTSKRWNKSLQKYSGLLISSQQREEEYGERVKKAAGAKAAGRAAQRASLVLHVPWTLKK